MTPSGSDGDDGTSESVFRPGRRIVDLGEVLVQSRQSGQDGRQRGTLRGRVALPGLLGGFHYGLPGSPKTNRLLPALGRSSGVMRSWVDDWAALPVLTATYWRPPAAKLMG